MTKILIIGISASGKTTFARKLSNKLNIPLTTMDSIMWKPNWEYIGDEETLNKLKEISKSDSWIIEGYITKKARTFLFDIADTIIYLDYKPHISAIQYIKRWLRHRKNPREELKGSPDKFSFKFFKLIVSKGEAITLNNFLDEVKDKNKIVKLRSPRETEGYLNKR